jgi:hypothetical protein
MNERQRTELRIEIERLVIDGLPLEPRHAARFRQALEAELAALLAAPGSAVLESRAVASVRGNTANFAPGGSPESWAASVARSVHGGISS